MGLATKDLEQLRRFTRTPDGRFLVEWLAGKLADTDVKLRTSSGEELHRMQGRAQLLAEMLETLTKAEARLELSTPRRHRQVVGGLGD